MREVATGCRSKDVAERVLKDLERRSELVRAGVVTPAEEAVADHNARPLDEHFAAYLSHLRATGQKTQAAPCIRAVQTDSESSD